MGFSIGPWEVLLIFVVIIIILGPHRLPEIARTLGKAFRAIKKASSDLSTSITREIEETKSQQPSSSTKLPTSDKPSPASQPESPKQDDQSKKTGGASAGK